MRERAEAGRALSAGAGNAIAIERLESRVLFAAAMAAVGIGSRPSPPEIRPAIATDPGDGVERSSLDPTLLALSDASAAGRGLASVPQGDLLTIDEHQRVVVTVRADDVPAATASLAALGFEPVASFPQLHFVDGYLPIASIPLTAGLPDSGTFAVLPSYRPMTNAGAVADQAGFVMEADRTRATAPGLFDGAGQKIGILSDSYDRLDGAADGVASGDLPSDVTVLQEGPSNDIIDEGRAMAELVHDLAPGAPIAFATAFISEGSYANNIRELADPDNFDDEQGAKVIVDDVNYFGEPMFQDGVIAQAIDEVVTTRGVNYFSAAGNQAARAYESTTFQTANDTISRSSGGAISGTFYDFDPGPGVDTRQRITVPSHVEIVLALQWDDPFYTTSGVDTNLDIYLANANSALVYASAEANNITNRTPSEIVAFRNPSSVTVPFDILIRRTAGPNPGRIKYVSYSESGIVFNEFTTDSPSLIPHAGATNGQGVAAAPYYSQTTPERFTSKGGQTILFSSSGAPLAPQVRNAPQLTGADGANTTFFGTSDREGDGLFNFFGTSAAAPHVAAVAALVRQANPSFTPAQVYSRLQSTADDITLSGVGFDSLTGFGMVNAFDAVYPTVTPAALPLADGLESGALSTAYETRSTGGGRILVTADNAPFAGAVHLTLDTSLTITDPATSVGNQFNLNEVTLHVNASGGGTKTLSFRQKEFGDADNPMPAQFTDSSPSDGIAMSIDGVHWFRVVSLTGAASGSAYALWTFDLSAAAAAAGIALSSDTRIRFQQYGDSPITSGGFAFDDISVTTSAVTPPGVTSVTVGDGTTNRSQVKRLTVAFDRPVVLAPGALTLKRRNTGGSGANDNSPPTDATSVLSAPASFDGGITWLWAFVAGSPFMQTTSAGAPTGSLVDGIYTATLDHTKVTAGAATMASDVATTFHRLFGDFSGSASVNNGDFGPFRNTFGKASTDPAFLAAFDFDNSGTVNNADLGQFRNRYGKSFTY